MSIYRLSRRNYKVPEPTDNMVHIKIIIVPTYMFKLQDPDEIRLIFKFFHLHLLIFPWIRYLSFLLRIRVIGNLGAVKGISHRTRLLLHPHYKIYVNFCNYFSTSSNLCNIGTSINISFETTWGERIKYLHENVNDCSTLFNISKIRSLLVTLGTYNLPNFYLLNS